MSLIVLLRKQSHPLVILGLNLFGRFVLSGDGCRSCRSIRGVRHLGHFVQLEWGVQGDLYYVVE